MVEHLCENLISETDVVLDVIAKFVGSKDGFTKAIGFGAMACAVMREAEPQPDLVEDWLVKIAEGAEDDRAEVRASVLWALLEIGKVDQYWQDAAIVLACELQAESQVAASLGHEAEDILNNTTVGDRRRLASGNSKSGRNSNQSQNNKRRGGTAIAAEEVSKKNADSSGRKPAEEMAATKEEVEQLLRKLFKGGPVERVPRNRKDSEVFLALAASRIESRAVLTESEVNDQLSDWLGGLADPHYLDHVMYDAISSTSACCFAILRGTAIAPIRR